MRDQCCTARLSRLIVAFYAMTTSTAAQSLVTQPVVDRDPVANRSTDDPPDNKTPQREATEESSSAQKKGFLGDKLRDSVWPFRTKQQSTDSTRPPQNAPVGLDGRIASPKEGTQTAKSQVPDWKRLTSTDADTKRRRWLAGARGVKYAPGYDPLETQPAEVAADAPLSITGYESIPARRRSTSLPAYTSGIMQAVANMPAAPGDGQDPRELPPALDQLPYPTPNSPDQPEISDDFGSMMEPSVAEPDTEREPEPYGLPKRFLRGYPRMVLWFPRLLGPPRKGGPSLYGGEEDDGPEEFRAGERGGGGGYEAPGAPRRTPPSPWDSPPFPSSEYQGYPLIGTPMSPNEDPLQIALLLGPHGDWFKDNRIEIHGWVTVSGNWSNSSRSNLPTAYWIVPNTFQLDQAVAKFEREIDWVQTDHMDWGFRWVNLYGIDYRYTTAGGVFSQQLLYHNNLYGYDPVEFWTELYIPRVFEGMVIRLGRWIACPDIEAQYAPDNYLASHSLLFTYDTYTQTGVMFSFQINRRNMIQGAIQSGTDMAPWYAGALATGFFGWRWVAESNNDAFYTCLNNINNGKFRYFMADGQKAGHDNFNYIVTTWEHKFNKKIHTKTEAYYMWQFDAVVGGTPSLGAPKSFGGGGGLGAFLPGNSPAYGVLNYTMFQLSKRDYFTIRNEWWNDQRGERTGFATNYSSHTIGISHQINDLMMIRPEIGYYHSYNEPAFNLGKNSNLLMGGFDFTIRF